VPRLPTGAFLFQRRSASLISEIGLAKFSDLEDTVSSWDALRPDTLKSPAEVGDPFECIERVAVRLRRIGMETETLVTVTEAARRAGLTSSYISKLINDGILPCKVIGDVRFVDARQLIRLQEEKEVTS
jgi:hypothetical protein